VHVNSNALLLPLICFRCSIYVHFHGEECACELTCSAPATLLSSVLNLRAFPHWRMCMWTQMLCSCHLFVFGAQFTCISRWRMCMWTQLLCSSHSILTGAHLLCSCILLFVLLTSCVLAVVYQWKKLFAWTRDFAWQPNFPTDCRTVPTNVILHLIGVSLRPIVSPVTYVLRTRTVISYQPNIFTLRVHPVVPATKTKTKESGYSFHTNYFCFKNACWLKGEPG
jgi:hypothetical protein